jgi:adenosylcobinamide-GDP ribazoletransferase
LSFLGKAPNFDVTSSQDSVRQSNMSDDFEPRNGGRHRIRPLAELLVALRFLTRLPVPFVRTLDAPPLHAAMTMFPLAGAVIGALIGSALLVAHLAGLPALFAATLAIAVGLVITGALHEDGLSDMADGFGGGHTREHRLDIMHDSRIGAFGALALGLLLMARASLYVSFLVLPPLSVILLLAGAAAFSRALMVDLIWATRPARSNGLSVLAGRPTRNRTLAALALGGGAAAFAGVHALSPLAGAVALIAGGLSLALVRALAMRKIGGQTGDVCGAAQVITEIAMLAVYSAAISLPSS